MVMELHEATRVFHVQTLSCISVSLLYKVISGLLQADESIIMNGDGVAQLLAHEDTRVFYV